MKSLALALALLLPVQAHSSPLWCTFQVGDMSGYWTLDSEVLPDSRNNPDFRETWWRIDNDSRFQMEWDGVLWTEANSWTDGFQVTEYQGTMWISAWTWWGFDEASGKSFTLFGKNLNGYEIAEGSVELASGESELLQLGSWRTQEAQVPEPASWLLLSLGALGLRARR